MLVPRKAPYLMKNIAVHISINLIMPMPFIALVAAFLIIVNSA